jgi:hypothetical protein
LRLPLLVLLLGLPACAVQWDGDPAIYGLDLDVALTQHNAAWTVRDDLKPRLRTVVAAAAAYWGIAPEAVAGWRLRLTEGLLECGGSSTANGCTTADDRTVTITANYFVCIESSTLVHELGHVALGGDSDHRDPRWRDSDALRALWADLHAGLAGAPDCGGEPYHGQWQGF